MKRTDSRKKARVRRKMVGGVIRAVKNRLALKIELVRPDDLLHLQIEGVNLRLDKSDAAQPALIVRDPQQPARLILTFPPQTIAEAAYFEYSVVKPADEGSSRPDSDASKTSNEPLDLPGQPQAPRRTAAQLGHPSRLVFDVPADARIPFSVFGLLDWSTLELNVNPIAAIGRSPTANKTP